MAQTSTCPKCGGRMAEGFGADQSQGSAYVASWHPGKPDRRWWGVKVRRKSQIPIEIFRCEKCGYLESYAK